MHVNDLKSLYIKELQEALSLEKQLAEAMPRLADLADDPHLRNCLRDDAAEVGAQVERLTTLIASHGAEPHQHQDQSMRAIIAEAEKWADTIDDPSTRDAALIASAQRIQHYEIAVYGSLATWAKELGLDEMDTLLDILEEEKTADVKLTKLAKREVNTAAAE